MQASAGFISGSALGMACGPALAGLLLWICNIYMVAFNQSTLPGWVMSIAWLLYLVRLWISFKEPNRATEVNEELQNPSSVPNSFLPRRHPNTRFTLSQLSSHLSVLAHLAAMANFALDPHRFVPPAFDIEDGGPDRVPRREVHLSESPPRAYLEYVIAEDVDGVVPQEDLVVFMQHVRQYIANDLLLPVEFICPHPFGIDLYKLQSTFHRDMLFMGNPHEIDGVHVRFIRHDDALNKRDHNYTRYGWIMMLGYPLDYRTMEHVDEAVSSFGKLMIWHNTPRALEYVLVKCLYNEARTVPRSLIFRQGERNGSGWSWTVPVYILNWEQPNPFVQQIEDIPPDGNPHPLPALPPPEEGDQMADLVNQNMHNLQQQHNQQGDWDVHIQDLNQEHPVLENGWQPWAEQNNNNQLQELPQDPPPAHEEMPVDSAQSINMGSTMSDIFQRGQGPTYSYPVPREDLSLVHSGGMATQPHWVQPFLSDALLSALRTAFPQSSSDAWWFKTKLSGSIQLNVDEGCSSHQNRIIPFSIDLQGPPRDSPENRVLQASPQIQEVNNDKAESALTHPEITVFYTRRGKKNNNLKDKKHSQGADSLKPLASLKKKIAAPKKGPVTVEGLRRSPRLQQLLDGHRHAPPPVADSPLPPPAPPSTGGSSEGT